jgi:multidrug transporter EmrE-like cation transporter
VQEVLQEDRAAAAEVVSGLLMQYVHVPCHSRVLPLVEVQVSVVALQLVQQRVPVSVARQLV